MRVNLDRIVMSHLRWLGPFERLPQAVTYRVSDDGRDICEALGGSVWTKVAKRPELMTAYVHPTTLFPDNSIEWKSH